MICSEYSYNWLEEGYSALAGGADTLDAALIVVKGPEDDPNYQNVGLGGRPNEEGVVELDASCMHGPTRTAGSVGGVRNIKNVSLVANAVRLHTGHVMLVGEGAERFAVAQGFPRENLLTEELVWVVRKGHPLVAEGVSVLASFFGEPKLSPQPGAAVRAVEADLRDPSNAARLFDAAEAAFGPVDILVNNAAYIAAGVKAEDESEDDVRRTVAVNLEAPIVLAQACFPGMRAAGTGSIVNVGSIVASVGIGRFPQAVTRDDGTVGGHSRFDDDIGVRGDDRCQKAAGSVLARPGGAVEILPLRANRDGSALDRIEEGSG
jgi:hypothetical protein